MKNHKISIKKVPLEGLLTILHTLFEKGVDYIDIYGEEASISKDKLHIYVAPDYYSKEKFDVEEYEEDTEPNNDCTITLTDDDINSLL